MKADLEEGSRGKCHTQERVALLSYSVSIVRLCLPFLTAKLHDNAVAEKDCLACYDQLTVAALLVPAASQA